MDDKSPQALLSPDQVAQYLVVSRKTVYRLAATGSIASVRIGGLLRFRNSDLDNYLDTVRFGGNEPAEQGRQRAGCSRAQHRGVS